jgi:hypothetical protein
MLKCTYLLVLYLETVLPNMDFWNTANLTELN